MYLIVKSGGGGAIRHLLRGEAAEELCRSPTVEPYPRSEPEIKDSATASCCFIKVMQSLAPPFYLEINQSI